MTQRFREPEPEHKEPVHPIWRGIGCILLVVIPIIAFAISIILYQEQIPQRYFPLTPDLANMTYIPVFDETIPLYYVLVVTALITFLSFVALSVVYAFIFRLGSGSRYGPLDAPPVKRKVKKSR